MSATVESARDIRPFYVDVPREGWTSFADGSEPRTGPRQRPSRMNPKACRSP